MAVKFQKSLENSQRAARRLYFWTRQRGVCPQCGNRVQPPGVASHAEEQGFRRPVSTYFLSGTLECRPTGSRLTFRAKRRQARTRQQLRQPCGLRFTHRRGIDCKLAQELPSFSAHRMVVVQQGKCRLPVIRVGAFRHHPTLRTQVRRSRQPAQDGQGALRLAIASPRRERCSTTHRPPSRGLLFLWARLTPPRTSARAAPRQE